jgi:hypothetical protein
MWSAYLFETTTGSIGPRLEFETLDWSIELNGIESTNLRLRKSELPDVDLKYWFAPWWAGVVLFWDDTPIVGGPIITRPYEDFEFINIGCGGIRSVLTRRFVIEEFANWDDLPKKGNINRAGMSLGTIVNEVVRIAQSKPGGALPITYAVPDRAGVHERNYRGFNIANLNADDVLTKLSDVAGGPDIMFKPRLLRPGVLTFDLWTGTDTQPRIPQKYTPVWDTTTASGDVSKMSVNTTGTYQTSRVFAIGTGQDEGTVIKVASDDRLIQQRYPLLETNISYSASEDSAVVTSHAVANLQANDEPLVEIQMSVRADGTIPIGQFWPGDLVDVVTKGWQAIPDGTNQMRLLSISGDHSNNVRVSLQQDTRYG